MLAPPEPVALPKVGLLVKGNEQMSSKKNEQNSKEVTYEQLGMRKANRWMCITKV
jgi:hypothetical protein